MGISGAAIATAISQTISFCILLSAFLRGRTITSLSPAKTSRDMRIYLSIMKNGLPSLCRQGLSSASTIALNLSAAAYGDAAVAGMSIVTRIVMLVFSVMIGIGQGYQPVLGYNLGAGRRERVSQAFSFTLMLMLALAAASAIGLFAAAPVLMRRFIASDPEVVRIGAAALRFQCLALPLVPLGVMSNMTLQSAGRSWIATILSAARQGIFFIPLILILPRLAGLRGLQAAQAAADACTFFFCIPFIRGFFRSLGQEGQKGRSEPQRV
jgi:Na+-driven multidrug efflux pump